MYFKNIKDLSDDIDAWIPRLPAGIECVVGIPRSGILPAAILSLRMNLPLADLGGFLDGRLVGAGRRLSHAVGDDFLTVKRKVLVLDDCISSGQSMRAVKEKVDAARLPHATLYASVYGTPMTPRDLCFWYSDVPKPRAFEWNVLHRDEIGNYCFDLDGVLCVDPSKEENDDGDHYASFIENAKPLFIPKSKVGFIVTSRLERYRESTEAWLRRNGVEYGDLIMLDLPSKEDRVRQGAAVPFKATAYRESGADLFVESDIRQAEGIASLSRKYVYSVDRRIMVSPGGFAGRIEREGRALKKRIRWKFRFLKKFRRSGD